MKIPRLLPSPVWVSDVSAWLLTVIVVSSVYNPQPDCQPMIVFTNGLTAIGTNYPADIVIKTNRSNETLSIERADGEPSRGFGFDVLRTNADGTIYILRPDGSTIRAVLADPETNQDQIVQTWDNDSGDPIGMYGPSGVTFSGFTVHLVPETNSDTLLPIPPGSMISTSFTNLQMDPGATNFPRFTRK